MTFTQFIYFIYTSLTPYAYHEAKAFNLVQAIEE